MRGLSSWIRSQLKPMRSRAPGAKFSTSTSQCLINFSSTFLPCGLLVSRVTDRLLWFSMVKYRLSTPGMSRSCSRVTSPLPAFSTLMTSAPNHASSWVQVGPDCTCVKSRMRTPLSALSMDRFRSLVHRLILGARRVFARIDPDIDHGRAAQLLHGLARAPQGGCNLPRISDLLAVSAEHLREFAERDVSQEIAHVAAVLAVFCELTVANLVH